jgi:hypothetical protein
MFEYNESESLPVTEEASKGVRATTSGIVAAGISLDRPGDRNHQFA